MTTVRSFVAEARTKTEEVVMGWAEVGERCVLPVAWERMVLPG